MKVIGYRKKGVGLLYFLTFLIGVLLILPLKIEQSLATITFSIFGGIAILISLVVIINILRIPYKAIVQIDKDTLLLPHKVQLKIGKIMSTSYECAKGRYKTYKWGTVIISTYHQRYKVCYIAKCKEVAYKIADIANKY